MFFCFFFGGRRGEGEGGGGGAGLRGVGWGLWHHMGYSSP